jgi:hypothetical protein
MTYEIRNIFAVDTSVAAQSFYDFAAVRVPRQLGEFWGKVLHFWGIYLNFGEFWGIYLKCVIFLYSQGIGLVRFRRVGVPPQRFSQRNLKLADSDPPQISCSVADSSQGVPVQTVTVLNFGEIRARRGSSKSITFTANLGNFGEFWGKVLHFLGNFGEFI